MTQYTDGVDHVNIYSKGKTELGRLLSNFAHFPFDCEDGHFESIEGYWYWLLTDPSHPDREELRSLHGYVAKKTGNILAGRDWPDPMDLDFRLKIIKAMLIKGGHPDVRLALLSQNLPFTHYYVYNGRVVPVKGCEWILDAWQHIRDILRTQMMAYPCNHPEIHPKLCE